jgi:thiosulfate/3-mercaptopyruvate sulfurtransferase
MTPFTALISLDQLDQFAAQAEDSLVLLDCGFDLADPAAGERAFFAGHLPGARYAHLDRDLSGPRHPEGPRSPSFTGRHPLPERRSFAERVGAWGIGPGTQVVTYDDQGGPYAARTWWMLRWLGHRAAAVLDGGKAAWQSLGRPLEQAQSAVQGLPPYPLSDTPAMPTIDAQALASRVGRLRLIDARAAERWRGEVETLDPVAGHIPGSTQRFFKDNLLPDGRFKPASQLRAEYEALGVAPGAAVVHQCGSGVTACHNLLAIAHAGLGEGQLYPGSWSEWCADPARPVARA